MYNYYKSKIHIEGSIELSSGTMKSFCKYPETLDVFHNVQVISGYLKVYSLKFPIGYLFPRLKKIYGKPTITHEQKGTDLALMIEQSYMEYLGLRLICNRFLNYNF